MLDSLTRHIYFKKAGVYCQLLVVCIMLLWPVEELFAKSNKEQMLFKTIRVKDGLPSNEVFQTVQDSLGFIWLATNNGFVRYDGYKMEVFKKDVSKGVLLPNNQVPSIVNARNNRLWIGTYKGLISFNTQTGKSISIDLGGACEIRCLLNQNDSVIWAGSDQGLYRINAVDHTYKRFNTENSNLGSDIVRALYIDHNKQLWIGTFDGLNVLLPDGKMTHFNLKGDYKPALKNNLILDIKPWSAINDTMLWIGTETGLVSFNVKTGAYKTYNSTNTWMQNEVVKCIFSKTQDEVYVGTDYGFYRINTLTNEIASAFHNPYNHFSISSNVVWNCFEDNAGILWLATSSGISKLNLNPVTFEFTPVFSSLSRNTVGTQVNDIFIDKEETVWLATKNGVIAKFSNGKQQSFTAESNTGRKLVFNNINTITGDYLGRIWIGSAGGINIWDKQQKKMHTITASFELNKGLRSNYISAFISAEDGSFWILTWGGGMYKVMGDFSRPETLTFKYIANFNTNLYSSNEKIWISDQNKIYSIDLNTLKIESMDNLNNFIGGELISSIEISGKGFLWLSVHNELIRFNTQNRNIDRFKIKTGDNNDILNLMEDFNGNIWGSTLTSIFRFSEEDHAVEVFSYDEGIPLDNFLFESKAISSNGKLYLGGNDGFISFSPREMQNSELASNVVLTHLLVNNKTVKSLKDLSDANQNMHISFCDTVYLNYDQNSVSIHFSSLHYENPSRNIYAYQLQGYDTDWIYTTGAENYASYSYLPSGKYTFAVKGTNADGVWSNQETILHVAVNPPIWAGTKAILLYFLVLLLLFILVYYTYRNKSRLKIKVQEITFEKEKNEALSKLKQQFFTNISHEFRTPLSLILGPVQTLSNQNTLHKNDQHLVQLISNNAKRLLSLVDQLLDLRKIETKTLRLRIEDCDVIELSKKQFHLFIDLAKEKNIQYAFKSESQSVIAKVDANKFDSIVQNLLSNAFKFTPDNGTISLSLELKTSELLHIIVADSGKGISKSNYENIFKRFYQGGENEASGESGYGIGLNMVQEYCKIMKGEIWFESEEGKGTVFYVDLPIECIARDHTKAVQIEYKPSELGKQLLVRNHHLPVVLVCDDYPDTLKFLEINLQNEYNVLLASNGKIAFDLLQKEKVDIIVSDIVMPELDGVGLCKKVKQHPKLGNTPFILLTAKTRDEQKIEGFQAGADIYLSKPFDVALLKVQIKNLLDKHKKMNQYVKSKLIIGNQEVDLESADEKLLQETIRFIHENIAQTEINVSEMCKQIGVSHSSLYRKVKNQTGMTLNELIRNVKLEKAALLLKTGKLTITEVMDQTGFSSHSYFAKCFKKLYQVSPRDYNG